MSAGQLLAGYRGVFSTLIVVASIQTLLAAPGHHVVLLPAAEIAGALLLLWRRAQWIGAALLLAVFAGAQAISAAEGRYPTHFLQYAASTVLILLLDRAGARARRACDVRPAVPPQ